jgi:aryl-alcohol dehydrogenase-like predicted oxidoreductase
MEEHGMRYKPFGNTGMEVSELTLGTWGIGGAGWDQRSEEDRLSAIRTALECGVNLIDTAPAYNAGEAERYVGRVLEEMGMRQKVYVATKCGTEFIGGAYVRDCSAEVVIRECESSLRNLRTDYIDLYLIHWPDGKTPFAETMDALERLKKQGKILHAGVSNFTREQMEEVGKYGLLEVCQTQHSMVFQENEERMRWASARGMGVMAYGALGGGILTGAIREKREYAPSDSRNRFYRHFQEPMFSKIMALLKEMDRLSAARDGVPLSQIALNWSAQKPFVSSCVVGAQSGRRVRENADSFGWSLTAEESAALDEAIARCLA